MTIDTAFMVNTVKQTRPIYTRPMRWVYSTLRSKSSMAGLLMPLTGSHEREAD